jgi:hypothetical protein
MAAVQTDHIVVPYRSPHWHSGSENFLGLIGPSKLRKRSMYRCNEFRNPTGPDCMMLDVTPDDSGGEMRIDFLRFDISSFQHYCTLQRS